MQPDSQIVQVITEDPGLRQRLRGIVTQRVIAQRAILTAAELAMLADPPLDAIAVEVATNPTVLEAVKDAIVDGNIGAAVQSVTDDPLVYIVCEQLPRLAP